MSTEMKKLIIGGTEYEIVDDAGRTRITALEQGGGTGLTQTEKNLLLTLFEKAAYAENDAGTAYTALSNLWTGYTITWSGTGYTKSNSAASVTAGATFTSTVTANTGFTLTDVTATMGGNTVQGAWSNGTVTIPNVTGDIVITVTTSQMTVSSISAVYTQSGTVYDTDSLDSLKSDLVVTATFMDSSTGVIDAADYTLSGTLTEGTSTITVAYGGLTTTFNVTVSTISPLGVMSAKGSTWASFTDNGDGTYTLNPTPENFTPNLTNPYWTLMNVSDIKGGTLSIEFDDTYKSGSVQVVAYASRNKDMTDVVAALNGVNGWDDTYQFTAATVNVASNTTIQMYPNAYTWIWIRNGSIIMGDDTATSNVLKHGYIVDGHITFTIS